MLRGPGSCMEGGDQLRGAMPGTSAPPTWVRRRRTRGYRQEDDRTSLMQGALVVREGVQIGHLPDEEATKIATQLQKSLNEAEGDQFRHPLRSDLAMRPARNVRSKVPAVQKVAKEIEGRIKYAYQTIKEVKKQGKKLWMRVRAAALKWARKKSRPLELLQREVSLSMVDQGLSLMQTQLDVVAVESQETPPYEHAENEGGLCGDDALWYQRLQLELQRIQKGGHAIIGAHAAQLHYYLKQMRATGVFDNNRAEGLDAFLVSLADEPTDETSSRADEWALKWRLRVVAFVGADDRTCQAEPYRPDLSALRRQECEMFAELRREIESETAASKSSNAQAEEDRVLAQAMNDEGGMALSTRSSEGSRKRLGFVSASVQSVGVEGNGDVVVSFRVASHKSRRTIGVQTE